MNTADQNNGTFITCAPDPAPPIPIVYPLRINKFVRRDANGKPIRPGVHTTIASVRVRPARFNHAGQRVCPRHQRTDHVRQGRRPAPDSSLMVVKAARSHGAIPLEPQSAVQGKLEAPQPVNVQRQPRLASQEPDQVHLEVPHPKQHVPIASARLEPVHLETPRPRRVQQQRSYAPASHSHGMDSEVAMTPL